MQRDSSARFVGAVFGSMCCVLASAADLTTFLHPPGTEWGVLMQTNGEANSVVSVPDGFVVAGTARNPAGGLMPNWAFLNKIGPGGSILASISFTGEEKPNSAYCVLPVLSAAGAVEGYLFAGAKQKFLTDPADPSRQWDLPWTWVVRTDASFGKQWESLFGVMGCVSYSRGFMPVGDRIIVGGDIQWPTTENGPSEWLVALDTSGVKLSDATFGFAEEDSIYAVEAISDGYVLATGRGVVKVNNALELQWRSGDTPVASGLRPDSYSSLKIASDGTILAIGSRRASLTNHSDLVLTKFSTTGAILSSQVLVPAEASSTRGKDLVLTSDGGCAIVGAGVSPLGAGGSDLWVVKLSAAGEMVWDLWLGGPGDDSGESIALAADGDFILAGTAQVDAANRAWLLKVNHDLNPVAAAFTYTPASPVFRDREITFDASSSSAGGSAIVSCEWDFGDGSTGSGTVVRHTYTQTGAFTVRLVARSEQGPAGVATRSVEVIGLALQWERFYGTSGSLLTQFIEARDGGFILAGQVSGNSSTAHAWVLKTDRRGKFVWEKFHDAPLPGTEETLSLCRAVDGGYLLAGVANCGAGYTSENDAFLLKIDESGDAAWPMKLYGDPAKAEAFNAVQSTADGYFFAGSGETNGSPRPILLKTDAAGNVQWQRLYDMAERRWANLILPLSDGRLLMSTKSDAYASWIMLLGADGLPIATNVPPFYSHTTWLSERDPVVGGFVVSGWTSSPGQKDMWLRFLNPDATTGQDFYWNGPCVSEQYDIANHAIKTADGGCILIGSTTIQSNSAWHPMQTEVALLKFDRSGRKVWTELFPGTTNKSESASSAVALSDGSFVLLGSYGSSSKPPVWLFRIGPNYPPTPEAVVSANTVNAGDAVQFSGAGSSDRDGSVVAWEWDFADGTVGSGATITHTFNNAGTYPVTLTVVDNNDAERFVTNIVRVLGVSGSTPGFTILNSSVTNDPIADPVYQPMQGGSLFVNWGSAHGFRIAGIALNSSSKKLRVTFAEPIPAGQTLYSMPAWTPVPYTLIDQYTVEIDPWVPAGSADLRFVLARTAPLPRITNAAIVHAASRIRLTFATDAYLRYRVEQSTSLAPASWLPVRHARTEADALSTNFMNGSGLNEALYVELPPTGSAFLRIAVEAIP